MPKQNKPRLGAHVPTSGGMAKRSIEYAQTIKAEAIQVFASNPRGWAMPEANRDAAFDRLASVGVELTTVDMLCMEWLRSSKAAESTAVMQALGKF